MEIKTGMGIVGEVDIKPKEDNSAQASRLANFAEVHGQKEVDFTKFLELIGPFKTESGEPVCVL